MVDRALLARQVATVRDAVGRIRSVLPPSIEAFEADRTAREVVIFNLFVAIQEPVGEKLARADRRSSAGFAGATESWGEVSEGGR